MKYKKETWLDHEIVTSNHGKQEFYFIFSPHKELSQQKYFYFSANNIEYQLIASFSVPKLPEIAYP